MVVTIKETMSAPGTACQKPHPATPKKWLQVAHTSALAESMTVDRTAAKTAMRPHIASGAATGVSAGVEGKTSGSLNWEAEEVMAGRGRSRGSLVPVSAC